MALIAAAAVCYGHALGNPFVFDDVEAIVDNDHIRSLSPIREALAAPPQSAAAGRPVVALTLALNYAWGALSPWGYHLFNLGIHAACGVLLFLILRRALALANPMSRSNPSILANPTSLAFAASLLWLVHPLQTEVVDYVIQRTESMVSFCYLVAFYASIRVMTAEGSRRGWTLVAVAAAFIGVACKEVMVTAPVLIALFDVVFVAGSISRALRNRRSLYGGLTSSWILLGLLNASGPRWRSAGFSSGVSPSTYLLHQTEMLVTYLTLVFWPDPLIVDYGLTKPIGLVAVAPYVAVVAALVICAVVAFWRRPAIGFLGIAGFVLLAPSSSVVPILTEVGAERRMYLALAAVLTLIVVGVAGTLEAAAERGHPWLRSAGVVMLLVIAAALGTRTVRRNLEYGDPLALWQDVLAARPHGRARYALAAELKNRGRMEEALAEYKRAAEDYPDALYALGFEYRQRKQFDSAIENFQAFVAADPIAGQVPKAYTLLGLSLNDMKRHSEAIAAFRTAIDMRPQDPDARGGLGDALLGAERFAEAVDAFRIYLKLAPNSVKGHSNLGRAFIALEQPENAVPEFTSAVQLAPDDAPQRMNLAFALAAVGRLEDAVAQCRQVLSRDSTDVKALSFLGRLLAAQGKIDEARVQFDRALRTDPTNALVREDMRAALGRRPGR